MFCEKKVVLFASPIILLSIFFIDLFIIIINTSQRIYIFNSNTRLMIKKVNTKHTLTSINDKKDKKYTLTCINI